MTSSTNDSYTPALKRLYFDDIVKSMKKELGIKSNMQIPKLEKIVLNIGLGKNRDDKKVSDTAFNTLRKITGQNPIRTKARKSIAAFKLRTGNEIGLKVTLRGDRMYEFLERLIRIVIPRFRDFHGLNRSSFDQSGNYHLGIEDQTVFPELTFEDTVSMHGLQMSIVTNSTHRENNTLLLESFGLPFEAKKEISDGPQSST